MTIPIRYQHWRFVWIPLFGSFFWFGTVLSMLITWLATGRPQYESQEGNIAYISDVGASYLKPLFIVGSSITAVCFFSSLVIERWLRHTGRLMPTMRRREFVFGILAVISAFMGGLGLILLSVFDTAQYTTAHRVFLLVFMLGVSLSAIFTVVEYRWISKDYVDIRALRIAYIYKAIIAGTLIVLAIIFTVLLFGHRPGVQDAAAVIEWTIAFGFTLYILTYYVDLRRSKNMERGSLPAQSNNNGHVPDSEELNEVASDGERPRSLGTNENTMTELSDDLVKHIH